MRQCKILRGLPGCGKSYWTMRFCMENKTSVCTVSADTHHYVQQPPREDGTLQPPKYEFKPENIGKAHKLCFLEFLQAINEGWQTIIVDNTNTTGIEIAPYYKLAEALDFDVEIVTIYAPLEVCVARGKHNVPTTTYAKMLSNLENEVLPKFWKQTSVDNTP